MWGKYGLAGGKGDYADTHISIRVVVADTILRKVQGRTKGAFWTDAADFAEPD